MYLLCIIYAFFALSLRMTWAFFDFFVQKSFLTKNYFLTAEINLTTRGPLYTCLVLVKKSFLTKNYFLIAAINFTTWGPSYTWFVDSVFGMTLRL